MHGCRMIIAVIKESVWKILVLSAPFLIVSIVLGLVIAVFQAATQIHEQTLTFVPKLFGILLLLLVLGSWMMVNLTEFFNMIMSMMVEL